MSQINAILSGSFGEMQIVALPGRVRLDVQGRHYTVEGDRERDHGCLDLDLESARRAMAALAEVILRAEAMQHENGAGVWSDETVRHIAVSATHRAYVHRPSKRRRIHQEVAPCVV